jgi:hypothetical protein
MSTKGHSLVHCRSMAHQLLLEAENEPEAWRSLAPTRPWFGGLSVCLSVFNSRQAMPPPHKNASAIPASALRAPLSHSYRGGGRCAARQYRRRMRLVLPTPRGSAASKSTEWHQPSPIPICPTKAWYVDWGLAYGEIKCR